MKRFLMVALGLVVIVGAVAALSPSVVNADYKDPNHCKGRKVCRFEPGPIDCPPCYYVEVCAPNCGCRPIPGCKVTPATSLAVPDYGGGIADQR